MKKYYYDFIKEIPNLTSGDLDQMSSAYPGGLSTEEIVSAAVRDLLDMLEDSHLKDAWFTFDSPLYDADTDEVAFESGIALVQALTYNSEVPTLHTALGSITLRF